LSRPATISMHYCCFLTIFFWSYYFFEFADLFFQDAYNTWLKERYNDDPSIHPDLDSDLWLKVGSFSGPNRNYVYCLSNTTTEDLWTARIVPIVGYSQSVPSTQTLDFKVILDQQVQVWTTHLTTDYEQLSAETIELRWLVMEMRSHMGGACALFYSPHGPDEDLSLPPLVPLF